MSHTVLNIEPLDGGPVDEEHVTIAVRGHQAGWSIEKINEALQRCKRPAVASWGQIERG